MKQSRLLKAVCIYIITIYVSMVSHYVLAEDPPVGPYCGDGILDIGEECDIGIVSTTGSCIFCANATCGDNYIWDDVEECDDGNTDSGDGCSSTCFLEEIDLSVDNFSVIHQYATQINPDITLILSETALVEVDVSVLGPYGGQTTTVVIRADLQEGDGQIVGESGPIKLSDMPGKVLIPIEVFGLHRATILEASIDDDNIIADATDAKKKTLSVVVANATPLSVALVPVTGFCDVFSPSDATCYDQLAENVIPSFISGQQGAVVKKVFPNEVDFLNLNALPYAPQCDLDKWIFCGSTVDFFLDLLLHKAKVAPHATNIVGVMRQSFFDKNPDKEFSRGVIGLASPIPGHRVAFVSEVVTITGNGDTLAHELAHTFGQGHPTINGCRDEFPLTVKSGFDPRANKFFTPDTPDFKYISVPTSIELSNKERVGVMQCREKGDPWFTIFNYQQIIYDLTNPLVDPPLIVVGGLFSKAGDFSIKETFTVEEGFITPDTNGSLRFSLLDENAETLASTSVDPGFTIWVLPEDPETTPPENQGAKELDYAPVVVALPALSNAKQIVISSGGNVLATIPVPTVPDVDEDGDGVLDSEDACPGSNVNPTVAIQDCSSKVENKVLDAGSGFPGCTILDMVAECEFNAVDHSTYVNCVDVFTDTLVVNSVISGKEKGKIQRCAARSSIGK